MGQLKVDFVPTLIKRITEAGIELVDGTHHSLDIIVWKVWKMAPNPRMSDRELAAINAAAVTREYNVKPHLGVYCVLAISRL